jgi:hypothetical protein
MFCELSETVEIQSDRQVDISGEPSDVADGEKQCRGSDDHEVGVHLLAELANVAEICDLGWRKDLIH